MDIQLPSGVRIVKENKYTVTVGAFLDDSQHETCVSIYKPKRQGDGQIDSEVNWPACGASSPQAAQDFAKLLTTAVRIARCLNTVGVSGEWRKCWS